MIIYGINFDHRIEILIAKNVTPEFDTYKIKEKSVILNINWEFYEDAFGDYYVAVNEIYETNSLNEAYKGIIKGIFK
jgi:hypothetical protein